MAGILGLIFLGFVDWSPFKVLVGQFCEMIFGFSQIWKRVVGDNLSMTFLFFFAGSFDKARPVLRLKGQKVGDELSFSVCHLSF